MSETTSKQSNKEQVIFEIGVNISNYEKALQNLAAKVEHLENLHNQAGKTMSGSLTGVETKTKKLGDEGKKTGDKLKEGFEKAGKGAEKGRKETEKFDKEIKKVLKSSDNLKKILMGLVGVISFAFITREVGKTVEAFRQQELAVNSLNQALKNQGIYSDDLSKQYQTMAGDLQKVTTFGDEQIIQSVSLLTAYTKQKVITKELVASILDFSKATGMDLNGAFMLVGKTIGSSTNALSRYGINLKKGMTESEKMTAVQEALEKKFGGSAEAAAKGAGKFDQFKNLIGDLYEDVGGLLTPALVDVTEVLIDLITEARNFINNEGEDLKATFQNMAVSVTSFKDEMNDTDFSLFKEGLKTLTIMANGLSAALKSVLFILSQIGNASQVLSDLQRDYLAWSTRAGVRIEQNLKDLSDPGKFIEGIKNPGKRLEENFNNWKNTFLKNIEDASGVMKNATTKFDQNSTKNWKNFVTSIGKNQTAILDAWMNNIGQRMKNLNRQLNEKLVDIGMGNQGGGPSVPEAGDGKTKKGKSFGLLNTLRREALESELIEKFRGSERAPKVKLNIPVELNPTLNEDTVKKLGLTADDVAQDFASMFDKAKEIRKDYVEFTRETNEKQLKIEEDYSEKLSTLKAKHQAKLIEITTADAEGGQKTEAIELENQKYLNDRATILREYFKKVNDLKKDAYEKTKDWAEKESKVIIEELKKQVDARDQLTATNRRAVIEIQALEKQTAGERKLMLAKMSEDAISIIEAEYQIRTDKINESIELERLSADLKIKELDKELQKTDLIASLRAQIEQQKVNITQESVAKIDALEQQLTNANLDRTQKEIDAYAQMFQQRLGFIGKLSSFMGQFFGQNNIFSKVGGFISQQGGFITELFKNLGAFGNTGKSAWSGLLKAAGLPIGGTAATAMPAMAAGYTPAVWGSSASNAGFWGNMMGVGTQGTSLLGKALPLLGGAGVGGLLGWNLGYSKGWLGPVAGTASGALTGLALGGGLGALIGGGAGLIGGLLGWIFGGRSRREKKNIGIVTSQESSALQARENEINGLLTFADQAKNLNDYNSVLGSAESKIGDLNKQIETINYRLSAQFYKKRTGEAAEARDQLLARAQQQKDALERTIAQMKEAIRQRQELIKKTLEELSRSYAELTVSIIQDPFRFPKEQIEQAKKDVLAQFEEIQKEFGADAPEIVDLARKVYQAQLKQIEIESKQIALDIEREKNNILSEMAIEHAKASGASELEVLQEEKAAMMKSLELDMKELRLKYADNEDMLTRITQYEVDKRKNLLEEFKDQYLDVLELIEQRAEIAGSLDFQRQKTRAEQRSEQIQEIDDQLKTFFASYGINDIQDLYSADELKEITDFLGNHPEILAGNVATSTVAGTAQTAAVSSYYPALSLLISSVSNPVNDIVSTVSGAIKSISDLTLEQYQNLTSSWMGSSEFQQLLSDRTAYINTHPNEPVTTPSWYYTPSQSFLNDYLSKLNASTINNNQSITINVTGVTGQDVADQILTTLGRYFSDLKVYSS